MIIIIIVNLFFGYYLFNDENKDYCLTFRWYQPAQIAFFCQKQSRP